MATHYRGFADPRKSRDENSEVHWERWLEKDKEGWKAVKR